MHDEMRLLGELIQARMSGDTSAAVAARAALWSAGAPMRKKVKLRIGAKVDRLARARVNDNA
jgi:hypothetical protein